MSADLYCKYFGFAERPFSLSPDPDFLFWARGYKRAYSVLEYGLVTHAPLTVLTGEVGTGKTTLIQHLLRQIGDNISVGLISNAQGNRDDLLRWILNALDVEHDASADYVRLFQTFQDYVIESYAEGRRVVIVIDEAQNLGMETLEELRMLTNINSGKDELLQLILVGQPELRQMIEQPELRQFAQRVTATYHIHPLDKETTKSYVESRLIAVGGQGDEITQDALEIIYETSEGIPRIVNKICDLALVYAASGNEPNVDAALVKELIADGVIIHTAPVPLFLTHRLSNLGKVAE